MRVFNGRGELVLRARLDLGLRQGCVAVCNGYGREHGGAVNLLSLGRETDMGYGAAFHDNLVQVEAAAVSGPGRFRFDPGLCPAARPACWPAGWSTARARPCPGAGCTPSMPSISPACRCSTCPWPATTAGARPAWNTARPGPTGGIRPPAS